MQTSGAIVPERTLLALPRRRIELPEGFVIGYGNQPPHCHEFAHRHVHEETYFSILVHGDCLETVAGHRERCLPKWVASFHPSCEDHARKTGPKGYGVFGISIPFEVLSRSGRQDDFLAARDLPGDYAVRFVNEYLMADDASAFGLTGAIFEMLSGLMRSSPRDGFRPKWLIKARDLLLDGQWSLSVLADEVAVSPTHLAREFRRHFGASVGNYARSQRLEAALFELANSADPISSLAARFGFADESHFVRQFKRRYGVTPARYRRENPRKIMYN